MAASDRRTWAGRAAGRSEPDDGREGLENRAIRHVWRTIRQTKVPGGKNWVAGAYWGACLPSVEAGAGRWLTQVAMARDISPTMASPPVGLVARPALTAGTRRK